MDFFLDQLNPNQREAAGTIEGPLLVLAGAGTGKTRVITYRIANMIYSGIPPQQILGMTFTNKAAREMRERLAQLVNADSAKQVTLGTFHAFCARLLRREIHRLGEFDHNYTICGEADQKGVLRQAAIDLKLFHQEFPIDEIGWMISAAKNTVDPYLELGKDNGLERQWALAIYPRYQKILENQNMVDFDDLLQFSVQLLENYSDLKEQCNDYWRYLLVDEYQDTNAIQFRLLELLAGSGKNICVVGDDDQSIYGWRGAKVENILQFPDYYAGTKVVRLEQNYRSTPIILQAANAIINHNQNRYGKELWSQLEYGDPIHIVRLQNGEAESQFIADTALGLSSKGASWNEMAVLYRSNHLSRTFENSLRRARIPFQVVGSKEFFQRKEILDAAAYLRLALNPRDDQSLLRIIGTPSRGLGDKAISALKRLRQSQNKSMVELLTDPHFLSEVGTKKAVESAQLLGMVLQNANKDFKESGRLGERVKQFLGDCGYLNGMLKIYKKYEEAEQRRENVDELINTIYRFEEKEGAENATLSGFVESYALMDDHQDNSTDEKVENSIKLMTVHAAKGLEFPIVFLVGLENNIFPHQRSLKEGQIEEERRLFYVAVTRAKEQLYMTHCAGRFRYGEMEPQSPSPFLKYLPPGIVEHCSAEQALPRISHEEAMLKIEEMLKKLREE